MILPLLVALLIVLYTFVPGFSIAVSTCECQSTQDGYAYMEWAYAYLGTCAYTPAQRTSVFMGLASIGCWLVAQIPQVAEVFRTRDASGLSPKFIAAWFIGDSCNLIGTFLTNQLATQKWTAVYFLSMDFVLVSQWLFYEYFNSHLKSVPPSVTISSSLAFLRDRFRSRHSGSAKAGHSASSSSVSTNSLPTDASHLSLKASTGHRELSDDHPDVVEETHHAARLINMIRFKHLSDGSSATERKGPKTPLSSAGGGRVFVMLVGGVFFLLRHSVFQVNAQSNSLESDISRVVARRLLLTESDANSSSTAYCENVSGWDQQTIIGFSLGTIAAICYLGSRIPQLVLNYRRKSTDGVSVLLFTFAVLGNSTYGVSILLFSQETLYVMQRLPWLCGSLGALFFDAGALWQFFAYRHPAHAVHKIIMKAKAKETQKQVSHEMVDMQSVYSYVHSDDSHFDDHV
eukprot:ANDGO_02523.mRNA.1 Lysosomal amino acid transporter 1